MPLKPPSMAHLSVSHPVVDHRLSRGATLVIAKRIVQGARAMRVVRRTQGGQWQWQWQASRCLRMYPSRSLSPSIYNGLQGPQVLRFLSQIDRPDQTRPDRITNRQTPAPISHPTWTAATAAAAKPVRQASSPRQPGTAVSARRTRC